MRTLRPHHALTLAAIGAVAAVLRLGRLDLMEFKYDEASAAEMLAAALGGSLPEHGLMSSIGVHNPSIFLYLLMLPGVVSADPIALATFVALLNVGAVFLCWWFGRRIFNDRVAAVAALLYAVSPWAVLYSRKIWAQDCLPFFSLVVIGGAHELIAHRDRRWFLPAALAAGVLPGIHPSALFVLLLFPVAAAMSGSRIGWTRWGLASVLLAALYAPFFLGGAGRGELGEKVSLSNFSAATLVHAAQLMGPLGFDRIMGASPSAFTRALGPALQTASVAAGALLILLLLSGSIGLGAEASRRVLGIEREGIASLRRDAGKWLALAWAIAVTLGGLLLSLDRVVQPHYLIILYPLQFWFAATALDWLWKRASHRLRSLLFVVIATVVFVEIAFVVVLARVVGREGGAPGDYGVAYRHKLAAAASIRDASAAEGAPVEVRWPTGRERRTYEYLLDHLAEGERASTSVAPAPFLIIEQANEPPAELDLPREDEIETERRFGPVRVLRLRH